MAAREPHVVCAFVGSSSSGSGAKRAPAGDGFRPCRRLASRSRRLQRASRSRGGTTDDRHRHPNSSSLPPASRPVF